jgi:hypothetical protein
MKKIKSTKTVYCYYYPKTREIITELTKNYPHDVYLRSIDPGLDDYHLPVIDKYVEFAKPELPALGEYKYRYFSSGASEGIFHILAWIKNKHPEAPLYVFKGEYEGYKAYGENIGLTFTEVDFDYDTNLLEPGIWFLSNPSARDGNIIENKKINKICEKHKVVYDVTYVGLTRKNMFDVNNKNILAVIVSMSKPFGVYYYRIGFVFSRVEFLTLMPNKWFKNILSIQIAGKLLEEYKPREIYERYRPIQEKIVKEINEERNLHIEMSDVVLLGYTKHENQMIKDYLRNDVYRFCLTPYFLEKEDEKKSSNLT